MNHFATFISELMCIQRISPSECKNKIRPVLSSQTASCCSRKSLFIRPGDNEIFPEKKTPDIYFFISRICPQHELK